MRDRWGRLARARLLAAIGAVAAGSAVTLAVLVAGAGGAAAAGSLPTLTVALQGKTVTVGGQRVSGAVNVSTTVTGETGGATLLVQLDPGVTAAQAFQAVGAAHGDPNALDGLATIVLDQDAVRGATTVGQTVLQPGNYVALDGSQTNKKGPPPFATFTVTKSSAPAALPAAAATVTSIEFGFKGPTTFHVGEMVRAVNAGYLVHMDDAQGVPTRPAGLKVIALLRAGKDRQAQKLAGKAFFSFAEPLSHGSVQQAALQASPGWYVEVCFMNTQDGREHTQLGMERLIRVVK